MPSLTQLALLSLPSIQLVSSLSIPIPLRARQTQVNKRGDDYSGDYGYGDASASASATASASAIDAASSGYPVLPGTALNTTTLLNSTDSSLNITHLLEGYDLALLTYENGTAYIVNDLAEVECTGVGECEKFLKTVGVEEIECDDDDAEDEEGSEYGSEDGEEEDCDDEVDSIAATYTPTPTATSAAAGSAAAGPTSSAVGNNYAVTGGSVGDDGYTSVTSTAWMYVTSGAPAGATGTSFGAGAGAAPTAAAAAGGEEVDTTSYGATKTVTEYVTITIDGYTAPKATNSPLNPQEHGASATSPKVNNNLAGATSTADAAGAAASSPAVTGSPATGSGQTGSGSGSGTESGNGDDDDEDCEDGDYEDDGDDEDDDDDLPYCDDDEAEGETGSSYDDEDGEDCDDEEQEGQQTTASSTGNVVEPTYVNGTDSTGNETYSGESTEEPAASATLSYDDASYGTASETASATASESWSAEYSDATASATASATDSAAPAEETTEGGDDDVYISYVDVYATEYVEPSATASASDEAVTISATDGVLKRHGHGRGRSLRKVVRRV